MFKRYDVHNVIVNSVCSRKNFLNKLVVLNVYRKVIVVCNGD